MNGRIIYYCGLLTLILISDSDLAARVTYRVLGNLGQKPVISVSENGILSSGSVIGSAAVHVVAQEEFGVNQTLIILIKVSQHVLMWRAKEIE